MAMTLPATRRMAAALLLCAAGAAWADGGTVYRCPGPPVLYTDQITAVQAKERGCRTIEGAPITIVSPPKPRPVAGRAPEGKVEAGEQRAARDAEQILERRVGMQAMAVGANDRDHRGQQVEGGQRIGGGLGGRLSHAIPWLTAAWPARV